MRGGEDASGKRAAFFVCATARRGEQPRGGTRVYHRDILVEPFSKLEL